MLSQHVGYKGRSRKRKQANKKGKTSPKPKKTNPKKKTKTDNKATASKRKRKIGTNNENPKLKISDSDDGHSSDDSLPTSPKRKQATKKAKTSPKPKKTNPKKKTKTDNKATASKRKRKIGTKNEKPKLLISDSDDGHSSDDSLPTCPSRAWKRFRRAKLPDIIRDKLVEEVNIRESEICDSTFDKFQWIPFLNRVAREYSYLHKRRYANDVMHLHREQILVAAVATIMDQLKPLVVKPLEGNRAEIVSACQRMIETAFGLAGLKKQEKKSSAAWIASVIKSGKYTCRECDEYPELMDAKVTSMMNAMIKMGSPTGAYILQDGQQVPSPDALYQLSERRVGRRRATVFQRAVCQCCSVNVCQCSGVGVPA